MTDLSIQITLTVEEIEQLAKVAGYELETKEDLYQVVLMAIDNYIEMHKEVYVYENSFND